jgi:hypothetical protein
MSTKNKSDLNRNTLEVIGDKMIEFTSTIDKMHRHCYLAEKNLFLLLDNDKIVIKLFIDKFRL